MGADTNQGEAIPANNLREDSTISIPGGAPYSSAVAFQPQQTASLDADLAEHGDNDGYNSPPMLHDEHLVRGAHQQTGLKRRHQMRLREPTRKRLRTRERNAPETTATPEVEDSD